jgi:hypothetical protein
MKKLLFIIYLFIAVASYAQRPEAGNKVINAGFTDLGPGKKGGFLVLKKYKDTVNAYRVGMSFISDFNEQDLNSKAMVITEGKARWYTSSFNIFIGQQRSFLRLKRFEPYIAGDLGLNMTTNVKKIDTHITDTLYSTYNYGYIYPTNIPFHYDYPSSDKYSIGDYQHGKSIYPLQIGIRAVVSFGFNYFLFRNLAIGAEFKAFAGQLSYNFPGALIIEETKNGVYERTESKIKGKGEMELGFTGVGFVTMSYCIR